MNELSIAHSPPHCENERAGKYCTEDAGSAHFARTLQCQYHSLVPVQTRQSVGGDQHAIQ